MTLHKKALAYAAESRLICFCHQQLPLSSGLDRTPRPPLKKLTEESEEENADHTPANPMALSQVSQHPPRQPAALKTSDAPVLAEQQNRSDVPLKRAGSSSLAVMHRVHGRHSAGKRPALHKKKNSSKISLSRNASSKNVRIIEDTVIDSSGVIVTSSNSSSSNAKARSRSRSPGKPHNSYTMSRTSSTSNASGLVKDRKRLSSSSLAQSPTRTKPIDMQMRRVSTQNASDSAGPASSEPRSVVRGFNTSGSPESPVMPRAPFCSPAQGPPPKCNLASGPPTPPEAQVTLSPIPPPPSPKKPMAGRKNKFFLGTQSCSDSDEMAKSPELHLAVTQPFPHNSSLQEQPRSGSSHSHHGPSSLKNEQHFSHMTATTDKTAEMEAEVEDADDSSGWGSDYTSDSEERPPVTKGKDQATKGTKSAVKQPEKVHEPMFKRVPTAPGQLNRLESRTGLLTQLFKPSAEDVRAVDTILRQHRSAVNLPRNYSTGGLANPSAHPQSRNRKSSSSPHKALQSSKSTVALPVMSYERGNAFSDIESPQVLPHDMRSVQKESSPTRRKPSAQQIPAFAGRRLGGKPADVELSDDSDDEENKLLPAAQPIPEMAYTPTKQAALAAAVQRHQAQKRLRDQGGAQPQLMPTTPRTTRRSMLSTEMSESVRRNLLWERQSRIRLLGGPLPDRQPHGNLQTSNSSSQVPHQSVLGNSSKGQKAELKPKTWQFSGGFHEQ